MLILVRHGQTVLNAGARLQGRGDAPLTELGRQQAAATAAAIAPDRVVSSPLLRARETAAAFGLAVDIDDRWVELDYGELDGVPIALVPPELWAQWRSDVTFAPPGGESLAALGQRVRGACEELREEAATRDVVVVTHVSPVKAAVAWALGVGDEVAWRMFLDVGAVSRISVGPRGPTLVGFNRSVESAL